MTDYLGEAEEAPADFAPLPPRASFLSQPATAALIAFPLAVAYLMGTTILRGVSYTMALAPAQSAPGTDSQRGYIEAGALLSVAFGLIPIGIASRGLRSDGAGDQAWVEPLLRSARALAIIVVLLRAVVALLLVVHGGDSGWLGYVG